MTTLHTGDIIKLEATDEATYEITMLLANDEMIVVPARLTGAALHGAAITAIVTDDIVVVCPASERKTYKSVERRVAEIVIDEHPGMAYDARLLRRVDETIAELATFGYDAMVCSTGAVVATFRYIRGIYTRDELVAALS